MLHSYSRRHWLLMLLGSLILAAFLMPLAPAQAKNTKDGKHMFVPTIIRSNKNDMSPSLRALCSSQHISLPKKNTEYERPNSVMPKATKGHVVTNHDPAINRTMKGTFDTPSLIVNVEGLSNIDNYNNSIGWVLPPDTEGAVGPAHYVQFVNLVLSVFSKDGTRVFGPIPGNAIWTGFGGACETSNDGDPIVLYDHIADRWIISQFALPGPDFYECVAISQSGDPTGSYYRYEFTWPNGLLPDYPKLGIWPDGYYLTANQFDPNNWAGAGVAALEREKMLTGQPALMIYFDLFDVYENYGGILPSSLDGPLPPEGSPNYFAEVDDSDWGFPADEIHIWQFHADWETPANSTFGLNGNPDFELPTDPFDPLPCLSSGNSRYCIPQPDTTARLDSLGDRLMFKLQYRNFGSHEDLVVNHTVTAGDPDISGVRLYQILLSGTYECGTFPCIFNQETHTSEDGLYRWMGSVAQDGQQDICAGFSTSGTSSPDYPSIAYACWIPQQPDSFMYDGEQTLYSGTGSQGNASLRWGDYSAMHIDPVDDCTFWYTDEYYVQSNEPCPFDSIDACWHTRIGSFKYPECTAPVKCTIRGYVRDALTSLPVVNALVEAGGYSRSTNGQGYYEIPLPPDIYNMTASATAYDPAEAFDVDCGEEVEEVIVNQDFLLNGLPVATYQSNTFTDYCPSGGPHSGDGIIDPGERVVLQISLGNTGHGILADAEGQLSSTTTGINIFDPNGAWPVIMPGSSSTTTNNFGFEVGSTVPCHSMADFALHATYTGGGPLDQNFSLLVGPPPVTIFSENFSDGIPPSWTVVDGGECSGGDQFTWNTTNFGGRTIGTPLSPPFAIADADYNGSGCGIMDEQLITPSIDASDCAQVRFSFSNQYRPWYYEYNADVDVSNDGGTTWNNVLAMAGTDDGFPFPNTKDIDITDYAAGQSNVQLRFHYSVWYGYWWAVDNVKVSCVNEECHPCVEPSALTPHHLMVDPGGFDSNNGVFEPGESALVEPVWHNGESLPVTLTGHMDNFTGPGIANYTILDGDAKYASIDAGANGSCAGTGNCYVLNVSVPSTRPTHWDATVDESITGIFGFAPIIKTWKLHIGASFSDVLPSYVFYPFIENVLHHSITTGCTSTLYCPLQSVPRWQMAMFIARAVAGDDSSVPQTYTDPGTGLSYSCNPSNPNLHFTDISTSNIYCRHAHYLWAKGYMSGCTSTHFCPSTNVNRFQMAMFIARAVANGESNVPQTYTDPDTGLSYSCNPSNPNLHFTDVAVSDPYCRHTHYLWARGFIAGCTSTQYCPAPDVQRDQMSKFITNSFQLMLYSP